MEVPSMTTGSLATFRDRLGNIFISRSPEGRNSFALPLADLRTH